MFPVFLSVVHSEYVEITPKSLNKVIGSRPVFLKYYSSLDRHSIAMANDFSEASTRFPDVIFAGINCSEHDRFCEQHGASSIPVLRWYSRNSRIPIDYDGGFYSEVFIEFVESKAQTKARPSIMNRLIELTSKKWERSITSATCGLVMFHIQSCSDCEHMRPQVAQLTTVFEGVPNVTIATIDCGRYQALCKEADVEMYPDYDDEEDGTPPDFKLWSRGKWLNFTGRPTLRRFVSTINRECGVDRRIDGLLGDSAGRIAEADEIARQFIDAEDQMTLIERTRTIPGAEFYVKVMERFVEKGFAQMKKDILTLKKNLAERKGSPNSLDLMKKRFNVFNSFLPPLTRKEPQSDL
jgi:hypothetical protein